MMVGVICIFVVIGVFLLGLHYMDRIDFFLEKNYKALQEEDEIMEPSAIILAKEIDGEETE